MPDQVGFAFDARFSRRTLCSFSSLVLVWVYSSLVYGNLESPSFNRWGEVRKLESSVSNKDNLSGYAFSSSSPSHASWGTKLCDDPKANRFVKASPLCVAAVCQDGILVIATHSLSTQEPLTGECLFHKTLSDVDTNEATNRSHSFELPVLDSGYSGPRRITSLHCNPLPAERKVSSRLCLATAGWRSDCQSFVQQANSFLTTEQIRFGNIARDEKTETIFSYLIKSLSTWLAMLANSDSYRPMNAVALLAGTTDKHRKRGRLCFIDVTGTYSVRALAIGHQACFVNQVLRISPTHSMTMNETLSLIKKFLVTGKVYGEKSDTLQCENHLDCFVPFPPNSTFIEIEKLPYSALSTNPS